MFFVLVFVLSVPFWLLGAFTDLSKNIPINLPIAALMLVNPMIAALILVYRENGSDGVKQLLKRPFDYQRIKRKIWYVPIFFLMPLLMVVAYGLMKFMGVALPDLHFPGVMVPVFFVVFFIAGIGEELGWSGYAIDPMQNRWGALTASIILGVVWQIWHIVPDIQNHQTPLWIVWHRGGSVLLRVLIAWLYNNTGKSIFAVITFHAMVNIGQLVWPFYGSYYDPFIPFILLAVTAAIVTFLWGPKTLARYRYARLSGSDVKLSKSG